MPEDRQIGLIPQLDDSPVQEGKKWLLVIGINKYSNQRHLDNAVADAKGFHAVMTKRYGFQDLVPPLIDEQATQANIREALSKSKTLGENDKLIVFYAGHGWYDSKTELGFIVPTEAKNNPDTDFIPTNFITTNIFMGVDAKHILLIVDCCFGGSFGNYRDVNVVEQTDNVVKNLDEKRSRWVLSSGGIEPVNDGLVFENNSPFMKPFLDVLNSNKAHSTVLSNLFPSLREKTNWTSKQMPQYKPIPNLPHKDGELGFYCIDIESEQESAYKTAIASNTIRHYENFLANKDFKNIELRKDITQRLIDKRAYDDFKKIDGTEHIENFIAFRAKHPNSFYSRDLAKDREEELVEKIKQRQLEEEKVKKEKIERERTLQLFESEIKEGKRAFNNSYYTKAFQLFFKHKDNENFDSESQFNMGYLYGNGQGVEQDFTEAIKWYEKAAQNGHIYGQINLGVMYENGYGVNKNFSEAVKWYQIAAQQGNLDGQYNLANMYENSLNEAIVLYRSSAKQGNRNAKDALKRLGYPE